jgi:uncharacterized membrane protein (Fun14 family)
MNKPIIKWLVLGLFLVALFYLTQVGLVYLDKWVVDTTPSLKTSQTGLNEPTEQIK